MMTTMTMLLFLWAILFLPWTPRQCDAFCPTRFASPMSSLKSLFLHHCSSGRPHTTCAMAAPDDSDESTAIAVSTSPLPLSPPINDKLIGNLVLLSVPLSWGSYAPVVRGLARLDPPVPGFVFSAAYYILASITLTSLALMRTPPAPPRRRRRPPPPAAEATTAAVEDDNDDDGNGLSSRLPILGGIELGSYLFLANCLQVIGLQTVESDRAGFLVQLTTVIVPIMEAAFAGNLWALSVPTWLACLLAFGGVIVMGFDGKTMKSLWADDQGGVWGSFSQGDVLIVGAAVLYSLHVVRLSGYARATTPLRLAAAKATTESIFSLLLVLFLVCLPSWMESNGVVPANDSLLNFAVETGQEISSFFALFSARVADGTLTCVELLPALGAVLWTGWITCSYTIWAQSFGQARVSPTSANLIYTAQPLFTSIFAFLLLGETIGPIGLVGGTLIAAAVYTVASQGATKGLDDTLDEENNDVQGDKGTLKTAESTETNLAMEREEVSTTR